MRGISSSIAAMLLSTAAGATEVTVKNDSLTDFGNGVIVTGFGVDEKAAVWLTSPCAGNVVALQVFWRSSTGTEAQVLQGALEVFRAGTFPVPGQLQTTVGGPLLNDGVLNEFRYLDENNTIPISVVVTQNETFVVSLQFAEAPPSVVGPSVVRDVDGNTTGRNAIYADLGAGNFQWLDSHTFGVDGDWIIRAVVNCQTVPTDADVAVNISATPTLYTPSQPLTYTMVVTNAGPAGSPNTTVIDTFPGAFTGASWTCVASGGASCSASGTGNIVQSNINLPSGAAVTYTVTGTVSGSMTGVLSNTATAAVGAPANDPAGTNNTKTLDILSSLDRIFADGFGG